MCVDYDRPAAPPAPRAPETLSTKASDTITTFTARSQSPTVSSPSVLAGSAVRPPEVYHRMPAGVYFVRVNQDFLKAESEHPLIVVDGFGAETPVHDVHFSGQVEWYVSVDDTADKVSRRVRLKTHGPIWIAK